MKRAPTCYTHLHDDGIPGAAVFRAIGGMTIPIMWAVGEHTTDVIRYGENKYVIIDAASQYVIDGVYIRGSIVCTSRASVCLFFASLRRSLKRCRVHSAYDFNFVLPQNVFKLLLKQPDGSMRLKTNDIEVLVTNLFDNGIVVLPKNDRALMVSLFDTSKHTHPLGFFDDPVALSLFRLLTQRGHYPELRAGHLVPSIRLVQLFVQHVTCVLSRVLTAFRDTVWQHNTVSTASGVYSYDRTSRAFKRHAGGISEQRGRIFVHDLGCNEKETLHTAFTKGIQQQRSKRQKCAAKLVPCLQRALSSDRRVRLHNQARMQLATILGKYSALCGTSVRDIDHSGMLTNPHSIRRRISHYFLHVDKNETGAYQYSVPSCASMAYAENGLVCPEGCSPFACAGLNNVTLDANTIATPITVMFSNE